jgi:hypothetical protein
MNIFIDTEFTDLLDPVLVSLGMVSDRDEELYIEVPFPIEKCTPFVHETVLPLLGHEPHAFIELNDARLRIYKWLENVRRDKEAIHICTDYQADWDLFCKVMDGRPPSWVHHKSISRDINKLLLYSFHKKTGLSAHHALYDARANKHAYRPRTTV